MAKFRRSPCGLGWTDHAFNRMRDKIVNGTMSIKIKNFDRKRRKISKLNDLLFHNQQCVIPF